MMGAKKHCERTPEVWCSAVVETDLDLFNVVMTQGIIVMNTEAREKQTVTGQRKIVNGQLRNAME